MTITFVRVVLSPDLVKIRGRGVDEVISTYSPADSPEVTVPFVSPSCKQDLPFVCKNWTLVTVAVFPSLREIVTALPFSNK